jgi:glycogen synthase
MESGGLMPMTASRYGTIPIVTQNGSLKDNFNSDNAIIIKNDIVESINSAIELYNN